MVYGNGLENRHTGNRIVSSNLTLTANINSMSKILNLRKKQGEESQSPKPKITFTKRSVTPVQKVIAESPAKTKLPHNPPHLSWDAPSFYFNPQKRYLALTVIALIAGGGGLVFFTGDKLTAIFLLLSSLVLILYSNKRPEINKIIIDQKGVAIGETIYYYKELKSFWIHYNPGDIKELSLESRKWYLPHIKVSIVNKNPLDIRSLVINFIPEREHEHSIVDIIARKIGL